MCALLYTHDAYRLPHGRHVCYCTRVILVHYRTDDTCATVHVRLATTDRNTRALPTRGHARPRVHRADRWIPNLCAHRSLCYSTRARWLHVGTPAPVYTVYGRSVSNLRARAGRYTTVPTTITQQRDTGGTAHCASFPVGDCGIRGYQRIGHAYPRVPKPAVREAASSP